MNIQTISNVSDCVPLYLPHSLYLKPSAKFNISVALPTNKMGKTISNFEIMEKLTKVIKPDKYLILKVSKSTLEFIRFEAELEDSTKLRNVLSQLDGLSIKMNGFSNSFKVRASEAKDDFPNRHDWDSFFRDANNMDEMKAGERPDTIHLTNLPIRWFCPRHMENDENVKPSENIFKRIFEKFGSVRYVDIPICDTYRSQMKSEITGMKTFKFDQDTMFEGYVQFSEYVGFVKAMDEFRGTKLIRKCGDKNQAVNIGVTFDNTKHLSDANIKRRNIVRDRLIAKERAKLEKEMTNKKIEQEKLEKERKKEEELKQKQINNQHEREEKRKEKHLKKLRERGQLDITNKILAEEKKLLIAQKKLESIRILEALFDRIKLKKTKLIKIKEECEKLSKYTNSEKVSKKNLSFNDLRNKLVNRYKTAHEELLEKQKSKLEQVKEKTGILSLLDGKLKQDRSPSVNSISSDDSVLSDSHFNDSSEKKKKSKKKKKKKSSRSNSSSSSSSTSPNEKTKCAPPVGAAQMGPYGGFYNQEVTSADWLQFGFYPYPTPMFPGLPPGIRPGFLPGSSMHYRGFPRIRSRGRGRGLRGRRGQYPSNSSYQSYENNDNYYKYHKHISGKHNYDDEYDDDHDHRRRSKSASRSRSKSRSRYRHRSRRTRTSSRSRSRSKSRSRSRSKSRHTHSRSRTNSRSGRRRSTTRSKSKTKLVSTRRSKSISWSRSRSRSRSISWSKKEEISDRKSYNHTPEKIVLQPEKLIRSAKEIQRSVQQKLLQRMHDEEDEKKKRTNRFDDKEVAYKKRSESVDSSKFISPKRKEKSPTPEIGSKQNIN